jgi:hypothetical protein
MKVFMATLTCIAMGAWAADTARADGPVREGLRDVGAAVAQGARAVAQGTADVAAGVGQAAANTVRGTANAAGNVLNGSRIDSSPNARWRFVRQNGQWWYWTPQNNWMYRGNGQWHAYTPGAARPLTQQQAVQPQGQNQIAQSGAAVNSQGVQRFSYAPTPAAESAPQAVAPATVTSGYNAGAYAAPYSGGSSDDLTSGTSFYRGGRWNFSGSLPARAPRNVNQNALNPTWGNVTR